ncbi:MAG: hypothetical protein HUK20_06155 [Fibrobacter sp.]|nr:hypothetical protein [Fibrobacter sp.]
MPTALNSKFRYVEMTAGNYNPSGIYEHGSISSDREVRGTLQSASFKEQIPAITGTRNTGNIEIYSSEQLKCRTRGGNDGGYVKFGSLIFQLISEQFYPFFKSISHWKYVAEMVPDEELPQPVKEAFA